MSTVAEDEDQKLCAGCGEPIGEHGEFGSNIVFDEENDLFYDGLYCDECHDELYAEGYHDEDEAARDAWLASR